MLSGQYIMHDGTGTTKVFTPSFPAGSEAATFAVDVRVENGAPTLVIGIDHKNYDEQVWIEAATFTDITAVGLATKDVESLKQQVRLSFSFTAGSAGDFFFLSIARPAWRAYN